MTPGARLRQAIEDSRAKGQPLHMIGVADGSDALAAEKAGFQALYISGSQVAASRGWADIGRIELRHVIEHLERVLDSGTTLPVLVDADTGFDDVAATVQALEKAGAAAVHIEDQPDLKFCGHLPGKRVIAAEDAVARISRAVAARSAADFVIMARTDALAVEGIASTLDRIRLYSDAGADMIFAEAFPDAATYVQAKSAAGGKPVLANMTEFGKVPLQTPAEIDVATGGAVDIVLNPLTIYRAQRFIADRMYSHMFNKGTQRGLEDILQTRADFQSLVRYDDQVKNRAASLQNQKPGIPR